MLHQNWFANPRFEMFNEYYDTQWFYDTESKCFYVVSELDNGNVQITEHSGDKETDLMFPQLMLCYEEWTREVKNWKKTKNGEDYYVSPNTGWVYMFYEMKSFCKDYPNTDMICCMCEYYSEQGIIENDCDLLDEMSVMEMVGWQFNSENGIPHEDMEQMIANYEDKRIDREVD